MSSPFLKKPKHESTCCCFYCACWLAQQDYKLKLKARAKELQEKEHKQLFDELMEIEIGLGCGG